MKSTERHSLLMVPSDEFVALARHVDAVRGRQAELLVIDDGNFRLAPPAPEKVKIEAEIKKVDDLPPPEPRRVFYAALYDKRGRRR